MKDKEIDYLLPLFKLVFPEIGEETQICITHRKVIEHEEGDIVLEKRIVETDLEESIIISEFYAGIRKIQKPYDGFFYVLYILEQNEGCNFLVKQTMVKKKENIRND